MYLWYLRQIGLDIDISCLRLCNVLLIKAKIILKKVSNQNNDTSFVMCTTRNWHIFF